MQARGQAGTGSRAEPGQVLSVAGDIQAKPWTSRDGTRSGTSYSIVVRGVLDADTAALAAD